MGGEIPPTGLDANAQRNWDQQIIKKSAATLLQAANDAYSKACLLATSAPHAGDWLSASPISSVGLRLTDDALRVAVGLRLGANICSPHVCRCSAPVDARGNHGLSCVKSAGRQVRHSLINDIINRGLSRAQIPASREPAGLIPGTSLRPDGASLIPWARGKCLAWDAIFVQTRSRRPTLAQPAHWQVLLLRMLLPSRTKSILLSQQPISSSVWLWRRLVPGMKMASVSSRNWVAVCPWRLGI